MKLMWPQWFTHKRFNDGLAVVVMLLGLYIVILPWWPNITLWVTQMFDQTDGYVYRGELSSNHADDDKLAPPPTQNTLVIPSIAIDERVIEGDSLAVIGGGGVWRRPQTSTPDRGGNTVIVGHRFSYSDPSTFYHLDKINIGERLSVWWNRQEYIYEVYKTEIVSASAIEIEASTEEPILTLYTCTPIWTARDRLVVKARLITDGVDNE